VWIEPLLMHATQTKRLADSDYHRAVTQLALCCDDFIGVNSEQLFFAARHND
jgi:hypothetical protein